MKYFKLKKISLHSDFGFYVQLYSSRPSAFQVQQIPLVIARRTGSIGI